MSSIGQATTPTFTCTISDTIDLTTANNVYFTIAQNGRKITKTGNDLTIEPQKVNVYLNQNDTMWLQSARPIEIQLNWTYANGNRGMTKIVTVTVNRNLLPEVLE